MERYLIGTSLSMCIGDIAKGKVSEENVALIVTGTKHSFESGPDWDEMYLGTFKDEVKVVAMEIVDRLWKQGRIHQPREVSSCYENSRAESVIPCHSIHWYTLSPCNGTETLDIVL
jgi:hypothetical protein